MRRNLANLRLLRRRWLPARPVGKEPLHEAALERPGRGDDILLRGDGVLDGVEHRGDAALFGEGREGDFKIQEILLAYVPSTLNRR